MSKECQITIKKNKKNRRKKKNKNKNKKKYEELKYQICLSNSFNIIPSYKNKSIFIKEYNNGNEVKIYKIESNTSRTSFNLENAIINYFENNTVKKNKIKIFQGKLAMK